MTLGADADALRSYVCMSATRFSSGSFTYLLYSLRTGRPGVTKLGAAGWTQYLDAHPDEHEVFQDAMTAKCLCRRGSSPRHLRRRSP